VKTFALSPAAHLLAYLDESASIYLNKLSIVRGPTGFQFIGSTELSRLGGVMALNSVRGSKSGIKLSWHPTLPLLAIPSENGSIVFLCAEKKTTGSLSRSYDDLVDGSQLRWKEIILVADPNVDLSHKQEHVNLVVFSPNGRYLVSADASGAVLVWDLRFDDISLSSPIAKFINHAGMPLHDIAWGCEVGENYLLATTTTSWCKIANVINASLGFKSPTELIADLFAPSKAKESTSSDDSLVKPAAVAVAAVSNTYKRLQKAGMTTASLFTPSKPMSNLTIAATNDETQSTQVDAEDHQPQQPPQQQLAKKIDNDDDDESVNFEDESISQIKSKLASSSNQTSAPKVTFRKEDLDRDDDDDMISNDGAVDASIHGKAHQSSIVMHEIPLQAPFQPSATKPDHLFRRYLVWNHVGSIITRESVNNRIDIRFSNTAGSNKAESFTDVDHFTKASLSFEGAIFANDAEIDETQKNSAVFDDENMKKELRGSLIMYRAFPNQSQLQGCNESFTYQLEDGEHVDCLAVGKGWAAVATSKNYLRIFSSTGIQLSISQFVGQVIAMTGYETSLAIVYHVSSPINAAFCYAVDLYDINTFLGRSCPIQQILSQRAIPSQKNASLTWIGFDVELNTFLTLDSAGNLISLMKIHQSSPANAGWQWVPVLDIAKLKKNADYTYWPIMVKNAKLAYVLLNGESKPSVYPQPVVSTKAFKLPIIRNKEGKDKGEAANERVQSALWSSIQLAHYENIYHSLQMDQLNLMNEEQAQYYQQMIDESQTKHDKALLKMMQEACRMQQAGHAIDLVQGLRSDISMNAAITVANHFGMTKVAEMVEKIKLFRQEVEEMRQQSQHSTPPVEEETSAPHLSSSYQDEEEHYPPMKSSALASRANYNHEEMEVDENSYQAPKANKVPVNPFAVKNVSSPSNKRKSFMDGIQEMKGSPSPKKPLLSVR
jgi:hypothetical protein